MTTVEQIGKQITMLAYLNNEHLAKEQFDQAALVNAKIEALTWALGLIVGGLNE